MPLIPFPNVPALPGVPALARSGASLMALAGLASLYAGDGAGVSALTSEPVWGLYTLDGAVAAEADSVVSFEHALDVRISDYPVEGGGFATFNRVILPFDQRITFAKGGSDEDRATFLAAIDAAVRSADLFHVVTPEKTYVNVSVTHNDLRRQARNGVTLLLVEVFVREVRVIDAATYSNTADPSGAAQVSSGTVQALDPTPAQTSANRGTS